MPEYHYCEQRSEEWERLHLGKITASEFSKIITPLGKESKQWTNYVHRLMAERVLKRQVDFSIAGSKWMDRGQELEPEAVADYEIMESVETKQVGFVIADDGWAGCSPDRLVGDDGLLELKCPAPQTMVNYLLTGEVEDEYKPQLQGQLFITQRKWVDIFAYHPEFPRRIIRVFPDPVYQLCITKIVEKMTDYMVAGITKIAAQMHEVRVKPDAIEELLK